MKTKIIRTATVPGPLNNFCRGLLRDLNENEGYEVVAVASPTPLLDSVAEREGIRAIGVPMERRISPLKDLKSLCKLIRVFKREKPQMVHSMTPKAGMLSMIAAWICRVPIRIHTFTGLVFPTSVGIKRKILMLTDKITCACATHVIPEGEGVKVDLQKNGITKKPLKVLGYGNVRGIDLDHYTRTPEVVAEAKNIRKKGFFTFIFIGRFVRDKGINELIEAFVKMHAEYPDTRLLLVGRFEQNIDPIKQETFKEIESNIAIDEVGQHKDVRPWLVASDALVFPSYREGFPNVVIEAGAMGLPSIVTDINGSREIIQQGKNGVIIPSKDVGALYEAMKELYLNQEKRIQMARAARHMVSSRYEQSFVRACLKDYYREILKGKK